MRFFFFFKQKTAYEMRISYWSSDVCSSDLPAVAGIWVALKGSVLTIAIAFLIAFPTGVLAALYLEEYAPKNRWTDLIEVSINNLAAVPSIIFGLLALAVFINWFGLCQASPRVGGLQLALMTMPLTVLPSSNAHQ